MIDYKNSPHSCHQLFPGHEERKLFARSDGGLKFLLKIFYIMSKHEKRPTFEVIRFLYYLLKLLIRLAYEPDFSEEILNSVEFTEGLTFLCRVDYKRQWRNDFQYSSYFLLGGPSLGFAVFTILKNTRHPFFQDFQVEMKAFQSKFSAWCAEDEETLRTYTYVADNYGLVSAVREDGPYGFVARILKYFLKYHDEKTGGAAFNLAQQMHLTFFGTLTIEDLEGALVEGYEHYGIRCHGCDMYPMIGVRYKCNICDDIDFCTSCKNNRDHEHSNFDEIKLTFLENKID